MMVRREEVFLAEIFQQDVYCVSPFFFRCKACIRMLLYRASLETLRIVTEEGLGPFWKGSLVSKAHRLPYSSVTLCISTSQKSFKINSRARRSHFCAFVGGGLAE